MGQTRRPDDPQATVAVSGRALLDVARSHSPSAGSAPFSLMMYYRGEVRVLPLHERRPLVIGRVPPADVVVPDPGLSRRHASIERAGSRVWVQDLGSTNGTWVDGSKVDRVDVEPGMELSVGPVRAAVVRLTTPEAQRLGGFEHELFTIDLEAECARVALCRRPSALLMLRDARTPPGAAGRWLDELRGRIRAFDRIALYSADTVELLLPEADEAAARQIASEITGRREDLRCGVAVTPAHGQTASKLLSTSRMALRRATSSSPVVVAVPTHARDSAPAEPAPGTEGPVVRDPAMTSVLDDASRLGTSVIPVLLLGETGTGKEIVARAIHEGGHRAKQPYVCVNCAAIPEQLVESTLFGHRRGAFTGAVQQSPGLFLAADGGSILLDEVGELPAAAQAVLLRALDTKRFTPVGATEEVHVDVRVIAATHRDLEAMVADGEFREDLYYRLAGMPLEIPPLRDRPEDIEPLAQHFLEIANRDNRRSVRHIEEEALDLLSEHLWPGNVRELRNVIERAVVITPGDTVTPADLPRSLQRSGSGQPPPSLHTASEEEFSVGDVRNLLASGRGSRDVLREVEAKLIHAALEQADHNRTRAAELLKVKLRTFHNKLRDHGFRRDEYRKDGED